MSVVKLSRSTGAVGEGFDLPKRHPLWGWKVRQSGAVCRLAMVHPIPCALPFGQLCRALGVVAGGAQRLPCAHIPEARAPVAMTVAVAVIDYARSNDEAGGLALTTEWVALQEQQTCSSPSG